MTVNSQTNLAVEIPAGQFCMKIPISTVSVVQFLSFELGSAVSWDIHAPRSRPPGSGRSSRSTLTAGDKVIARRAYCSQGLQKSMCVRPDRATDRPTAKSGSDLVTRNCVFDLQRPSSVTKSESSVTRSSDRR